MARNCPHFKILETLDCLHQSRARQEPASTAIQKRLAHQTVRQPTGRLIGAKHEAQRAIGSNDPAKFGQCQEGVRYGFQCPDTGHKIERAIFKRQRLQPPSYLWHRNVRAARKHGRRRVEQGHQMRRHALGNQCTCQFAGAASRIQQICVRRGERTHQGFQGGLCFAARMPQPAMMKPVIARCQPLILIDSIAYRRLCKHLIGPDLAKFP